MRNNKVVDKQATKHAINNRLDHIARKSGPDDTVIIFFSGHGMQFIGGFWPGEYLCPVEADLKSVSTTFISSTEFTIALQAIKSHRLVVFLDACHAGGVGNIKDTSSKPGLSLSTYEQLGKGRVIIASCLPDEVSWELSTMRNGLFTHYLLEGLRGNAARDDNSISVTGIFEYISSNVPKHKPQHPYLKSECENFILAQLTSKPTGMQNRHTTTPTSSVSTILETDIYGGVDTTKLRKAMLRTFSKDEFIVLCNDLGVNYDHIKDGKLEVQMMYLIDDFKRQQKYELLVAKVLKEREFLRGELIK